MLFGHQNDDNTQPANDASAAPTDTSTPGTNPLAVDPVTGASLPVPTDSLDTSEPSVLNQPAPSPSLPDPAGPPPLPEHTPPADDLLVAPDVPATNHFPDPHFQSPGIPTPSLDDVSDNDASDDPGTPASTPEPTGDLLELKQQAMSQLAPLVNQLDQSPEEKFRTTMMMLQSTDNPSLLQSAYEAAQAIPDEKVRAQALLDVINEINYFTQQKQGS